MEILFYILPLVLFAIIICGLSFVLYKKVWNPLIVFWIMIILSVIFAILISERSMVELLIAIFWIMIGSIFLSLSFLFVQYFLYFKFKKKKIFYEYNIEGLSKLVSICCVVSTLQLFLSIYQILSLGVSLSDVFFNSTYVRYLYLNRSSSMIISLLNVFLSLNFYITFCSIPLAIQYKCKNAKKKMIYIVLVTLVGSLITMSKEAFIIDCILLLSSYIFSLKDYKEERHFLIRYGKWFGLLIIVLLVVISFQRNYIGTRYNSYMDAIVGTIGVYVGIPIVSFGALISQTSPQFLNGAQCFRPLVNILSYLGLAERQSLAQGLVAENTGNVYSMFGNMFNDFGFSGIIFLSVFFGAIMGVCYRGHQENRIGARTVNALILMTMFFGYYDFKLIQTVYVLSIFYAVLFDKIFVKFIYNKKGNDEK